jgi:hypothetical protein
MLIFYPVMFHMLYNRPQKILYIYTHTHITHAQCISWYEFSVCVLSVFLTLSLISPFPKVSRNYEVQ